MKQKEEKHHSAAGENREWIEIKGTNGVTSFEGHLDSLKIKNNDCILIKKARK